jgi:hypothetical protein
MPETEAKTGALNDERRKQSLRVRFSDNKAGESDHDRRREVTTMITNRRDAVEPRELSIGDVELEESGSEQSAAVHTPPQCHPIYVLHLAAILLQRSKNPTLGF